jgi:hypothetical protein
MGKLEWTHNGKQMFRNIDFIVVQRPSGWITRRRCPDRLILGTGKFERHLYWYESKRRLRAKVWLASCSYLLGVGTGLLMQ